MSWVDEFKAERVEFPVTGPDDWKQFDKTLPIKRWIIEAHDDEFLALLIPDYPYAVGDDGKLKGRSLNFVGSYVNRINVPAPATSHIEGVKELAFPIKPINYDKYDVLIGFAGTTFNLLPKGVPIGGIPDSVKIDDLVRMVKAIYDKEFGTIV